LKSGDIVKLKLLAILLLTLVLLVSASGCVDDSGEKAVEENNSEEVQVNETPMDEEVNNETPMDEEEDGRLNIIESEDPRMYTVRMESFLTQPSNLTINRGDSVVWINFNDPTRIFTLISNENEWENVSIGYRRQHAHTFNETGTYTYKVLGFEARMKGTIIVK
jgi:plastocyanin